MSIHPSDFTKNITWTHTACKLSLKVSLFDAMADWMTVPLLHHDYGKGAPKRIGLAHPSVAPYGLFTCADGSPLVISIQNEREWAWLCKDVLNDIDLAMAPRFESNVKRVENQSALDTTVQAAFGKMSRSEAEEKLQAAKIAYGARR